MATVELIIEGRPHYFSLNYAVMAHDTQNSDEVWFPILLGMAGDCRTFLASRRSNDRYEYKIEKVDLAITPLE